MDKEVPNFSETPHFRGRIVPEGNTNETGLKKGEAIQQADEVLNRRQRGRVVEGGEVIPHEELVRRLEEKKRQLGGLSFSEEEDLRRLENQLRERQEKAAAKLKTKWP